MTSVIEGHWASSGHPEALAFADVQTTEGHVASGFLAHLRSQGMSEEHLSGFSHHVTAFCTSHPSLHPTRFTAVHLKRHLADEASRGASARDLRNRTIAIEALLDYLAATSVSPQPVVTQPATAPAPGSVRASAQPCGPSKRPSHPGEVLLRPWSVGGVLASAGLIIPILCGYVPFIGWWISFLYYPALVGYYLATVDHVGRGRPGMARFESIAAEEIAPSLGRGIACVLAMMLPFAIVAFWGPTEGSSLYPIMTLGSLTLGALLGPAVILSVYITNSAFSAFHPGAWWRIISELSDGYAWTAVVFAALCALVATIVFVTNPWLPRGPLAHALRAFVLNFFWLSQACALGGFVRRHSHRLGAAASDQKPAKDGSPAKE